MKRRPIQRAPWQRPKPVVTVRGSTIDPALRQLVKDRAGGMCECCDIRLSGHWECHHRKLKSQGGQDSAANLVALCFLCHRRIHSHRAWSEAAGFIVPSFEDPASVPIALREKRWVRLTIDGKYVEDGDAA